jgi:hypothetical protein
MLVQNGIFTAEAPRTQRKLKSNESHLKEKAASVNHGPWRLTDSDRAAPVRKAYHLSQIVLMALSFKDFMPLWAL